jgi:hypothetical protein
MVRCQPAPSSDWLAQRSGGRGRRRSERSERRSVAVRGRREGVMAVVGDVRGMVVVGDVRDVAVVGGGS